MKAILTGMLSLCIMIMFSTTAFAQEEMPKAKKMEGHSWHQVVMVKYMPGTMSDAMKMISDHFMKAGMNAETPGPQIMEFKTGEWDMMMVWTMDNIQDMDWEVTPDDEKWWKAMANQEGGMDKAMKVMQKYMDIVDRSTSYLAMTRQPMSDTMGMQEN